MVYLGRKGQAGRVDNVCMNEESFCFDCENSDYNGISYLRSSFRDTI